MVNKFNSEQYWNSRYTNRGNSGAGSYNELAAFKADVINSFVERHKIQSIIDYGVGDGNQLRYINTQNKKYIGIDVSAFIISKCKSLFEHDNTKQFIHTHDMKNTHLNADLVLSCDVLYHLVEQDVYHDYMNHLFSMSNKYVIIYAKNEDINHTPHVKFRKFSSYIEKYFPGWKMIKHIPNKFPQLIVGQNNDKTSPSEFFIYEYNDIKYSSVIEEWESYIQTHLIPIVKNSNVQLEGNIYSPHHSYKDGRIHLSNKRHNICNLLTTTKPQNILEIGFNAGFSCLLMKMIVPEAHMTCVDLNEHKYVMDCFEQLNTDFKHLRIIPGSSYDVGLPMLMKEHKTFDLIHIDGDHTLAGATKDLDLCLKLSHEKTIILFDDTNLPHLNHLCNTYVNKGLLTNYALKHFASHQKYKHRIFKANIKTKEMIVGDTPVYVSLTSIFKNQNVLLQTLLSITAQTILPDKIFMYLSEEPHILDSGFKHKELTHPELITFINEHPNININWVKNTGSYRKLLPLLKEKWNEDCIVITIDDDTVYDDCLVQHLLSDYAEHQCVVGYRGFTPSLESFENFDYLKKKKTTERLSMYSFLTGKGGILYKPEFFHKTGQLIFNEDIYMETCDKQDDVWFYILRVLNQCQCYLNPLVTWLQKDISSDGLYLHYNSKHNNNTTAFRNTIRKLKELHYTF